MPASRFLCEHLDQNVFFWTCISRIHAQDPVITTGQLLAKTLQQQVACCIDIAIMAEPASRAPPLPLIQPQLIKGVPALRAGLARGIPAIHFDQDFAVPLALVSELPAHLAERDVVDRTGVGELERAQLRQTHHSARPASPDALKPQSRGYTLALEARIVGTMSEEISKCHILIPQALRETGGWHLRQPFVPRGALPLRKPPREVLPREPQSALAVGFRADLERRVPEPAGGAQPAREQAALSTIRIGANAVAAREALHARILTRCGAQRRTQTCAAERRSAYASNRAARNGSSRRGRFRPWKLQRRASHLQQPRRNGAVHGTQKSTERSFRRSRREAAGRSAAHGPRAPRGVVGLPASG